MNVERELLERATTALERQEAVFARQAEAFDRQAEALDRQGGTLEHLVERSKRSEGHFIAAMSEIQIGLERNTQRLEDMGDEIKANTRAVLAVLDRLEPNTG